MIFNRSGSKDGGKGSDVSALLPLVDSSLDETQQAKFAVFMDGRVFIHEQSREDAAVQSSLKRLASRHRIELKTFQYVDIQQLREIRNVTTGPRQQGALVAVTDARSELNRLMEHAASVGANDIQLSIRNGHAEARYEIDGYLTLKPVREYDANMAEQMITSAINASDAGAKSPDAKKHQKFSLLGIGKIPALCHGVRGQTVVLEDGRHLNLRLILKPSDTLPKAISAFGFLPQHEDNLYMMQSASTGILTVVGPTGSGKSHLKNVWFMEYSQARNHSITLVQIAEPHEYIHPKFIPVHVEESDDPDVDPFYEPFKVSLRIAPHAIDINEVQTAQAATAVYKTARTSRLVATTLHVTDIFQIGPRYIETGVPAEMVFSTHSHVGWHAMRLVPMLCQHCRVPAATALKDDHTDLRRRALIRQFFAHTPDQDHGRFYVRGKGCEHCTAGEVQKMPGLTGRAMVAENTRLTPSFMDLLQKPADYYRAREFYISEFKGTTLLQHAYMRVQKGEIGLDEFCQFAGNVETLQHDLTMQTKYTSTREAAE